MYFCTQQKYGSVHAGTEKESNFGVVPGHPIHFGPLIQVIDYFAVSAHHVLFYSMGVIQ